MIIRMTLFRFAPDPIRVPRVLWQEKVLASILSAYSGWFEESRGLNEVRLAVDRERASLGRATFLDGELRRVYEEGFEARRRGLKPSDPEYPRLNPIYLEAWRFR